MKKLEITALYADSFGNILDAPKSIEAAGRVGTQIVKLTPGDLVKLPDNADLMFLPNRQALGFKGEHLTPIKGQAVAAILPAGFTRTHLPAYHSAIAKPLPLFGYTAVVVYKNEMHVAAIPTDKSQKWNPLIYNTRDLKKLINKVKKDLPNNRLVEHLAHCSLSWHCLTAQNLFYRRWECGIPTSPTCNANCLGCISLQPAECCPSPQNRIKFKPTVDEIAQIGTYHLQTAPDAIISFGQGCEGEPSLAADSIAQALKLIRQNTSRGQINLNTNAGFTDGIKKIVDAGLDSMRVSIISAIDECYDAYYNAAYRLQSVKNSIRYALDNGVFVSLNMLYMPGFNDRAVEFDAWSVFLKQLPVQMIQIRNLNIDPDWFFKTMPTSDCEILGTKYFLRTLQANFKRLQIANFSHFINSN